MLHACSSKRKCTKPFCEATVLRPCQAALNVGATARSVQCLCVQPPNSLLGIVRQFLFDELGTKPISTWQAMRKAGLQFALSNHAEKGGRIYRDQRSKQLLASTAAYAMEAQRLQW